MSRPYWLRNHTVIDPTDTPSTNALPRRVHERRMLLGRITDTLAIVAIVLAALWIGKHYVEWAAADIARDQGFALHHQAEQCPTPTEHEKTLVIVTQRDGKLEARCLLVGSRQAYHRTPSGMPEGRP